MPSSPIAWMVLLDHARVMGRARASLLDEFAAQSSIDEIEEMLESEYRTLADRATIGDFLPQLAARAVRSRLQARRDGSASSFSSRLAG